MGMWAKANIKRAKMKSEETSVSVEALQLVSKILRIPSSRGQYAKQMHHWVVPLVQANRLLLTHFLELTCYLKILSLPRPYRHIS